MNRNPSRYCIFSLATLLVCVGLTPAQTINVEGQPLAANALRLIKAYDYLGHPLPKGEVAALEAAAKSQDAHKLQELLDPHVLVMVHLNPEARVKVLRGPAVA